MKVYYNESCSICRAEINLYKKQNINEIEWVDITNNVAAEKKTSKDNRGTSPFNKLLSLNIK